MQTEDTRFPDGSGGECAAALPGPQRRGTGGTLSLGWEIYRDRGHLPNEGGKHQLADMVIARVQ